MQHCMSLLQTLTDDMKAAMKAKDSTTLDVIRMTLSSVKNKAIELGKELDDADVLAVVKSDAKKLKDSLQSFVDNAREDLADKVRKEISILEKYLPKVMKEAPKYYGQCNIQPTLHLTAPIIVAAQIMF